MFVVVYPPGLWRTLNLRMFALFFQRVAGGGQPQETQQMKVHASLIRNFTSKKLYRAAPPSKSASKQHNKYHYHIRMFFFDDHFVDFFEVPMFEFAQLQKEFGAQIFRKCLSHEYIKTAKFQLQTPSESGRTWMVSIFRSSHQK